MKYQVHYGYQQSKQQDFGDFVEALAFFLDHIDDPTHPRLLGAGFDDETSGLTDDESEAVLEANEMRRPRRRVG